MQNITIPDRPVVERSRRRKGLLFLLLLIIAIVLFAGLQPYGSFKENWVSFTMETGETHFGHYGLVTGELPKFVEQAAKQNTLELLITPIITEPTTSDFHIFAQIDSPDSQTPLIVGQWTTSFIAINGHDRRGQLGLPRASANLSRHVGIPTEISYKFGPTETIVELDGRYENSGPAFDFSNPHTRITIGNSPDGKFGWYGRLANVTLRDTSNPKNSISYRFDRNTAPSILADTLVTSETSLDLSIPKPGGFPDRAWIGSLNFKDLLSNNKMDLVVNFLGFAPFGFVLIAFLVVGASKSRKILSLVVTTVLGFLLSFGIETVQTFIPGRSPHVHDLFLNTSGTLLGTIGFLILFGIWSLLRKSKSEKDSSGAPATNIEL